MKAKTIFSMLLLWMTATCAMAEETSSLFVFLKDGSKIQFILPTENPTVAFSKGNMAVTCSNQDSESWRNVTFQRDEVDFLKVDKAEQTTIEEVQIDEPRIRFDLTRKGVVNVSGLQKTDRIQVYSLDGKSVNAVVSRHEGEATVDLIQQKRGVYMVSVNNSFTFKLMKP